MCNYLNFTTIKDCGLDISQYATPWTLICRQCSFLDQSVDYVLLSKEGDEFLRNNRDFTCYGLSFGLMMKHVESHIEAGHDVHPSVNQILYAWRQEALAVLEWQVTAAINKEKDKPFREVVEDFKYHEKSKRITKTK